MTWALPPPSPPGRRACATESLCFRAPRRADRHHAPGPQVKSTLARRLALRVGIPILPPIAAMSSDEQDRRSPPPPPPQTEGTETSISRLEAEQAYDDSDDEAQDVNVGKSREARREEEEDDEDDDEEEESDEDGVYPCCTRRAVLITLQTKETRAGKRGQVASGEIASVPR